jgi:hypothetical protein
MVNYPAIFVSNGTAILLLLVIIFSSKRSLCNGLLDEKIFSWMLLLNFLQCIIETVTFLTDGKIEYRSLSLFLNAVLFSNSTILAYFTAVYVDYKLFSDVKRTRRILSFLAIPAVLTIIGCLINILTPVFYEIDQYNIYHRTDLNIIPYVVNYSYIAYAVILIYLNREKALKLFFPAYFFVCYTCIAWKFVAALILRIFPYVAWRSYRANGFVRQYSKRSVLYRYAVGFI